MRAATDDSDLLLIAAMQAAPGARASAELARLLAAPPLGAPGLPAERTARGERDDRPLARRVRLRARRGTGLSGLVRRLLAGDAPSWWLSVSGLRGLAWRLVRGGWS